MHIVMYILVRESHLQNIDDYRRHYDPLCILQCFILTLASLQTIETTGMSTCSSPNDASQISEVDQTYPITPKTGALVSAAARLM